MNSSRIVPAKLVANQEDGLRTRNGVVAWLESTPEPGGWKVSVIMKLGDRQEDLEFKERLSLHGPLLIQNTPVTLALGADDDLFIILAHSHVIKGDASVGPRNMEIIVHPSKLHGLVDTIFHDPDAEGDAIEFFGQNLWVQA